MKDLLQVLVPQAVLLAVLGFLCRSIVRHWLTKDVARFKDQLHAEQEIQARQIQHALEIAKLEYQVRFTRLFEKRFEKIEELHADSRQLVDTLAESLRVEHSTQAERIMDARVRTLNLQRKLKLYEIFLPEAFVLEWEEELSRIYALLHRFASATSDPSSPHQPALRESVDGIAASIRRLNGELAERARSILEKA